MKYRLDHLRCEYLVNPLAIDKAHPRLSWQGSSSREGAGQSAYRILVAKTMDSLRAGKGDLWDSGKVDGSGSLHISYQGKKLRSFQQVFWKVMAWDEKGREGSWSKPASWTTGILNLKEWKSSWIGNYLGNSRMSPLLRKEFKTTKNIHRVLLHASALGLYHIRINGKDVGDDVFAPGWTDYSKRRYYRAYDVTKLVKKGANCIGAELGEGWYKGALGWRHRAPYGTHIQLLAQLRIEYSDGSTGLIASDSSWKSVFGATVESGFYEGESVDAQLEPKNWELPGFNDAHWGSAIELKHASGVDKGKDPIPLEAYPAEPVRQTEELKPITFWKVSPGKVIYDFGQNFAGRVRIHFKGKPGAVIRMRFGEMVNHDKTLYVDNLRDAISTDTYVMKGAKREVWEPKFTFHGFRYVEVSGCPVAPNLKNLTGVVIGSDTSRVGNFSCSNQIINKVYENAFWTQRANFLEVPTDCPQRDERLGWTGDAQVFIRTAIGNMDVAAFFTKWMNDLVDAQKDDGAFPNVAPDVLGGKADAAWGDAGVICPWVLYQCYEDRELLEKLYNPMKQWVRYLKGTSSKLIRSPKHTHCFADWLSINAETPKEVVQTAYFAHVTDLTRKAAEALGKKAEARRYASLFSEIRKAFNKAFVAKGGKIHGHTQTAYICALKFGLLNDFNAEMAAKYLVADIRKRKYHATTGFVGTAYIMSVLRDTGHLDVAYRLLENTTFPSWGYSVVNGATSIWERWNGWTNDDGPGNVHMNSYSHYAYGAVVEWMYDTIAGINHGARGFQHFVLSPQPGGTLRHARASYKSPYGIIESSWQKQGERFVYEVKIPPNTRATLYLPVKDLTKVSVNDCRILKKNLVVTNKNSFELSSGSYKIVY